MKNRYTSYFLLGLAACFASACTTGNLFVQNTQPVNLVREQGEFHFTGTAGSNGGTASVQYAAFNGLSLYAGGNFSSADNFKQTYAEAGLAFFEHGMFQKRLCTELILGYGLGNTEVNIEKFEGGTSSVMVSGPVRRPFIQMNVGWTTTYADFGLTSRISQLTVPDIDIDLENRAVYQSNTIFAEPGVFIHAGKNAIRGTFQCIFPLVMNTDTPDAFGFKPSASGPNFSSLSPVLSGGIHLILGRNWDDVKRK